MITAKVWNTNYNCIFDPLKVSYAIFQDRAAKFYFGNGDSLVVVCNSEQAMVWAMKEQIADLRLRWEDIDGTLVGISDSKVVIRFECGSNVPFTWEQLDGDIKYRGFSSEQMIALIAKIKALRIGSYEIRSDIVEFIDLTARIQLEVECPVCKKRVLAGYSCQCGRHWAVDLRGVGILLEAMK